MNVELWLDRFTQMLELQGRRPRTVHGYRCELRQFLNFLQDRGVEEIHQLDSEEVAAYQVHLHRTRKSNGEPLRLNTVNSKLGVVVTFTRFLHRSQVLLVDPARHVTYARAPLALLPKLLDEEEVERLLEAPDTEHYLGLRDRAVLELLYSSAPRNSELRGLHLEDIDLGRLEIRIRGGKGGKSRVVPMGEPAAAWVEEYLRRGRGFLVRDPDTRALFLTVRGIPLGVDALTDLVKKHALAAGLKTRVTPHILRHCCATHMLRRDARLRYLQTLLGHVSPSTTQRYTQVELSDLREVYQRCHPRESF